MPFQNVFFEYFVKKKNTRREWSKAGYTSARIKVSRKRNNKRRVEVVVHRTHSGKTTNHCFRETYNVLDLVAI